MSDKDEALRLCDCWTTNYGLDRDPHALHDFWTSGAPPACAIALKAAVEHIRSQHARIAELEAELAEQCRINGAGAERELSALNRVRELEAVARVALHTLEGWGNHGAWVWPESALEQAKRNTVEAIESLRKTLGEA